MLSNLGKACVEGRANSGVNFDYMYGNKAKGVNFFGTLIDNILLKLPAVEATRFRKKIIINSLQKEIYRNIDKNKKTKIVDLASGPARYLVELSNNEIKDNLEVLCLDIERESLDVGKSLAKEKPIRYMKADILNLNRLKRFSKKIFWKANIILASGFFVYQDDETVIRVLKDIYNNLDKDGLLIFTSQAYNPSKKLMEKLGKTSFGDSWTLFYRQPEFFEKLMKDIGYKDIKISLDNWGIYEFCSGRK